MLYKQNHMEKSGYYTKLFNLYGGNAEKKNIKTAKLLYSAKLLHLANFYILLKEHAN